MLYEKIYKKAHTHTHTHIYIYIYIFKPRQQYKTTLKMNKKGSNYYKKIFEL